MGGLIKSLEGAVLAVLLGTSMPASETPAFAQQKQEQPKKQERKLQEEKKADVPDDATQRFREEQVKNAFSEDYKKKDPASKLTLADKLSKNSDDPKNDVALTYVLKQEAIKAYAEGLDLNSAFDLAERVAESYNTSGLRLKCTAFNIARKQPVKDADQASSLGESGYELTGDLYIKGDFVSALGIVGDAKKTAKLPKEAVQKITDLESEIKLVSSADNTLTTMPDDAKANAAVARYTAFRRGKLQEAKDYAKKSADQVLIDLLDAELDNPDNSTSQYQLANQYFEASKKLKGFEKDQYKMRATFWYNEALPNANALVKADIEKKLKEMEPVEKEKVVSIDLLKLIDVDKDSIVGKWSLEGGALISPIGPNSLVRIPYKPPREYDLIIKLEAKDADIGPTIGLGQDNNRFDYCVDCHPEDGFFTGIYTVDGKKIRENDAKKKGRVLVKNKPATINCKVRTNQLTVTIDDKVITDWKGDFKRLSSAYSNFDGPLYVSFWQTKYKITQISLKPISGKGENLR